MDLHYSTKIGQEIDEAAEWLIAGEAVAIPTETVYGLAANALNEEAILKIFKAKERPFFNPLIVHFADWLSVEPFVINLPDHAIDISRQFTSGPLTYLLPKSDKIPDIITAGHEKVAIRIPSHPVTQSLLKILPFPLAAPSANRFGYVSPTTATHVLEGLQGRIPYVLDGGPCAVGLESTIIDFENGEVILRRKGGIAIEKIERIIGRPILDKTHASEHPVAPGQLKSHYATQTPLYIGNINDLILEKNGQKMAIIEFGKPVQNKVFARFNLSLAGDMDEAARNLFSTMRMADTCGAEVILVELLPESGLGKAINDRLKRAQFAAKD